MICSGVSPAGGAGSSGPKPFWAPAIRGSAKSRAHTGIRARRLTGTSLDVQASRLVTSIDLVRFLVANGLDQLRQEFVDLVGRSCGEKIGAVCGYGGPKPPI